MKLYLFISLILSQLIICQVKNETNNDNETDILSNEKLEEEIKKLNITIDEMDKMMLCSVFNQEALRKDKDRIEALANKTNVSDIDIFEKIGTDIFENCYRSVDMPTVGKYFKNLTYLGGYKWKKDFDKFIEIDYDKYLRQNNFNLTEEQEMLSKKFNLIKEKFKRKQLEDRKKFTEEQNKLKIGNIDLEAIPNNIKGVLFVIVFVIIFGGSIFFLKTLVNKPKKKKEKKKKNQ